MDIKETGRDSVDWTHLAQNMYTQRAVVSTAMNFWFYKMRILLTAELASSHGVSYYCKHHPQI